MSFLRYFGMVCGGLLLLIGIGLYMMWRGICTGDLSLFHPRF